MKPPGADPVMTPRDHGAGGSVGHHQYPASRSPGCGGRHGHRGQPEGPPCRGPDRRTRHAGVPGAGTGWRADARLAAPGEARPARTRCSAHLRPVKHATNRQRVIGRSDRGAGLSSDHAHQLGLVSADAQVYACPVPGSQRSGAPRIAGQRSMAAANIPVATGPSSGHRVRPAGRVTRRPDSLR
jgi:hypothetical protein